MLRLIALALFALPFAAQADTTFVCDGQGMNVEAQVSENAAATVLKVDGKEVPALRACMTWAHGNHRMGGRFRCPHGVAGSEVRYEVYPIVNKPNGEPNHVKVIVWNGASPRYGRAQGLRVGLSVHRFPVLCSPASVPDQGPRTGNGDQSELA